MYYGTPPKRACGALCGGLRPPNPPVPPPHLRGVRIKKVDKVAW